MSKADRIKAAIKQTGLKTGQPRLVGTGLTERTVVDVSLFELVDLLAKRDATNDQLTVLGAAMWPTPLDGLIDLKTWAEDQQTGDKGNAINDPDSRAWYASQILGQLEELKQAFGNGRPVRLLSLGLSLGALGERVKWKFQHESAALTGYARLQNERNRRLAAAASKNESAQRRRFVIGRERDLVIQREPALDSPRCATAIAKLILDRAKCDETLRLALTLSDGTMIGIDAVRKILGKLRSASN
jgi:hypothetical protein